MFGHRCVRCGMYWASHANPHLSLIITVLCPGCVGKLPAMAEPSQKKTA